MVVAEWRRWRGFEFGFKSRVGPAVSTSTKPDVWRATSRVRAGDGRVWVFDPTGAGGRGGGQELRWSPVLSSRSWDGALLIARAMTTNIGAGTTDRSYWASRAQALLAPMLHAAAVHGRDMETVVDWVMRHELDEAGILLEDQRCSKLAFGNLLGLLHIEDRERSSIFPAAADALQAYSSEHALAAARDPNFDAARFVRTGGTVYIHAPAEGQAAAAPIVCGLLAEIRRATYQGVSTTLREYDRQVIAHTRARQGMFSTVLTGDQSRPHRTTTYSTQRTRVLSPGEIANIPRGRALHLDGVWWELLTLTPAHTTEPWRTLTAIPAAR